jgi:hypothetical protein
MRCTKNKSATIKNEPKSFKNDKERIEFLFGLYEEYLHTKEFIK